MPLHLNHRALYAAFDRFPTPKGAAIRIARMAPALFATLDMGFFYALGDAQLPLYQHEGNVEIVRHAHPPPNFLDRALDTESQLIARDMSY